MRTLRAVQIRLGRNLVSPAALILVAVRNVIAAAICAPLALAVHRLAAARLGALLQSIRVGAGIPVVQSRLADCVQTAPFMGIVIRVMLAGCKLGPLSQTIYGLSAF